MRLQRSCRLLVTHLLAHPPLRAGDVEGRTSDSVLGPGPIHVIHRTATVVRASTPEGAIPRSAWLVSSLHNRGHRASRERLGRTLAFCTASASCLPKEARAGRWPSALSSQAPPEGGTGLTAPPERGPAQTGACVGRNPVSRERQDPCPDVRRLISHGAWQHRR